MRHQIHDQESDDGSLLIGRKEAGHQAAVIYTIIENLSPLPSACRRLLREVLEIIPTLKDIEKEAAELTSAKIAKARKGSSQKSEALYQ